MKILKYPGLNLPGLFGKLYMFFIFAFLIFSHKSYSQLAIKGKVLNYQNEPISYANIGIFNKGIGTLSEKDGSFFIPIPDKNRDDTLTFSAIGFQRRSIPIFDLINKDNIILMGEKVMELKEIVITDKRIKPKTIEYGNRAWQGPHGVAFIDTLYAGAAMALLIQPSSFPLYATKVRLRIQKNSFGNLKVRLRLLKIDSLSGIPGEELLHENIIIESTINKNWLKVDLTPYQNIEINGPFFLVFEWIMDDADRKLLSEQFGEYAKQNPGDFFEVTRIVGEEKVTEIEHNFREGILFGASANTTFYSCFYRTSSLGEWKKSIYIMTARITLSDVPPKK